MALTMDTVTPAETWDAHYEQGHTVVFLFRDPHARDEFFAFVEVGVDQAFDVYAGNHSYMESVSEESIVLMGDPGPGDLEVNLEAEVAGCWYDVEEVTDTTTYWTHPVTGRVWQRVDACDYTIKIGTDGNNKGVMQVEPKS